MTFSHTGTPNECMSAFEQFMEEQAPEKPQKNHMLMIAEHLILGFRKDRTSVHTVEAEVDLKAGTLTFALVLT